jgi:Rieske 2Fe-2S family protein
MLIDSRAQREVLMNNGLSKSFAGAAVHLRVLELLDRTAPGHTLAREFYNDPALYEFDSAAVFSRSWLLVGFESQLSETGAYIALTIGQNPLIVLRGRDGVIRGFHNACRHRGAKLCADGSGRSSKIICPYHKWTYEIDGRLIGAARMPEDFRMQDHGLSPIRVESLEGCIYAAITNDAPDFNVFRDAVKPFLRAYHLAEAKVAFESTMIEKANWKLVMENARECYHCASSHPELKLSFPITYGIGAAKDVTVHNDRFAARMQELGLSVLPVEGSWWYTERYALNPGMETISMDGKPVVKRRLIDRLEPEIGAVWWATQPNTFCHALSDYAFTFAVVPLGPQETRVDSKWLVHKDAVEGVDYTIEGLTETWTKTNLQDRELAENNQRGVNGLGYKSGPYSLEEDFVARFVNWYREVARTSAEEMRDA